MNLDIAQAMYERLCSFCKKTEQQVEILVAAPDCYICDACIDICHSIVLEHRKVDRVDTHSDIRTESRPN